MTGAGSRRVWSKVVSMSTGFAIAFLLAGPVGAEQGKPAGAKPAGPKPPSGAPKGKPPGPGPRLGTLGKAVPPPRVARWHVNRHYWHPVYRPVVTRNVWTTTGYPYYVGGTSYYLVDEPTVTPGTSSTEPTDTDVAYSQLAELVDMVHEWRTLNESSTLQDRLPGERAKMPAALQDTIKQIKSDNQEFDRTTRTVMHRLSAGLRADTDLEKARTVLTRLIETADKLPTSPREPGQGPARKGTERAGARAPQ